MSRQVAEQPSAIQKHETARRVMVLQDRGVVVPNGQRAVGVNLKSVCRARMLQVLGDDAMGEARQAQPGGANRKKQLGLTWHIAARRSDKMPRSPSVFSAAVDRSIMRHAVSVTINAWRK